FLMHPALHSSALPSFPTRRSSDLIEIVVARHVAGNILSGSRPVFFLVALLSPLVEPVRTGPVKDAVGGVFCPVKFCLLAGILHRSEEHTSELLSRGHLVCRLLLEK